MKTSRQEKADKIDVFRKLVDSSEAVVLVEYKGLTVHELEELRRKLREVGGRMAIVKNTLARVALNEMGIDTLDKDLAGQIAFVFSQDDPVIGPRIAQQFSRQNEKFRLVSGFFDGRRLTLEEVRELATLPSRDDLRARLLGIFMSPLTAFVATLQAPLTEFIGTLEARAKKVEETEGVEAAALETIEIPA